MSEAREFWISEKVLNDGEYLYQKAIPHAWPDWYPQVHTIEYSAYEGAMASLATMEEANDFKLEELKDLRAKHERVLQMLEIASKRSSYQWSEGPDYFPSDYANEGRVALALETLAQIESLK